MGRAPIGTCRRLGLALAMAPCLALLAGADPIPVPKRDYAAELDIHAVRNGEPRRIRGKIYWSPDRQRTELQTAGRSSIVILREDKGVTWSLAPLQQPTSRSRWRRNSPGPWTATSTWSGRRCHRHSQRRLHLHSSTRPA